MLYSTARVVTDRPHRYLKQLVSHMGHKPRQPTST